MEEKKQILQRLLEEGSWSDEDRKWFLEYLENNETSVLQELMERAFTENITSEANTTDVNARKILDLVHQKIHTDNQPAKVFRLSIWKKVAAAAVIIFLLGTGAYLLFLSNQKKEIAKTENKNVPDDIMPGGNKATLTLANGSIIVLNNVQNGAITQQGNTKILKLSNGQLAYKSLNEKPTGVLYNTITTPRGGQYQVILPDESKVWLNSMSSIRFPTTFAGSERVVEITGEVYFEVVHDAKKPFVVRHDDVAVQVLGTHFNVKTYSDAPSFQITLLEGAVKINKGDKEALLSPGWQAAIEKSGSISIDKQVNLDDVMAWKNGKFVFDRADIQTVMRILGRWYDIDVSYYGNVTSHFGGSVSMKVPISEVFKMLEMTGGVKFKIEGNNVKVLSGENPDK